MQTIIRKAIKSDCVQMIQLVNELALYERAPEEVTVSFAHFEESGFGENPIWWAFVAEQAGKIVGIALYYIRYSTWKGQRMYLEDIVVTESHRGKGVGHQLFEALIAEAREKNLGAIHWQVLNWNEPAINFYKKYNCKFDETWLNVSLIV